MSSSVIISAVQMDCIPYDKRANLSLAENLIGKAVAAGAKLAVLPELFSTGYCVADRDAALSEPVPGGETTGWMEALSRKHRLYLSGAVIERADPDGTLYDTHVLTGPEGYVGKYRKVCLWGAESQRFRSGSDYPVFDIGFARLGLQICYEVGFPEGARILALKGADMIAYSAAFGQQRSYAWELASRARALENGLYVAASNRFGIEKGSKDSTEFAGKSRIISPDGGILAETVDRNNIIFAEIDRNAVTRQRETIPYLRDYKQSLFSSWLADSGR